MEQRADGWRRKSDYPNEWGWYYCCNKANDHFFALFRNGKWTVPEAGFYPDSVKWWRHKFPNPEEVGAK